MQRILCFVMLAFMVLAYSPTANDLTAADEGKGVVVTIDGLKSTTPGAWKEETPSNRLRLTQFRLPKMGEDKDDAELVVFKGAGGGSKANVTRWKGQFLPPEGKTIDDVSEVKDIKIGGRPATYLDIHGTYKYKAQPFNPRSKEEKKPHYRMLAIYLEGQDDPYQIRVTGPAKTVEAHKKGFDEWLKNFK